jgi:hypothetical protein
VAELALIYGILVPVNVQINPNAAILTLLDSLHFNSEIKREIGQR